MNLHSSRWLYSLLGILLSLWTHAQIPADLTLTTYQPEAKATRSITLQPGFSVQNANFLAYIVPATPPIPIVQLYCPKALLTTNEPAPAGITYYFQTAANGVSTSNPSPFVVTTSGTYYLRALSSSGNWSAGASQKQVNIPSPCPQPCNSLSVAPCPAQPCNLSSTMTGPYSGYVNYTDIYTWTATVNCPGGNLTYDWYSGVSPDNYTTHELNYTGPTFSAHLPCNPSNYYYVKLVVTNTLSGEQNVNFWTTLMEKLDCNVCYYSQSCGWGGRVAQTAAGLQDAMDAGKASFLGDAFPNPTESYAQIEYFVREAGPVKLILLNAAGKVIQTIVETEQTSGVHLAEITKSDLISGLYFYRLETKDATQTKKLIISK